MMKMTTMYPMYLFLALIWSCSWRTCTQSFWTGAWHISPLHHRHCHHHHPDVKEPSQSAPRKGGEYRLSIPRKGEQRQQQQQPYRRVMGASAPEDRLGLDRTDRAAPTGGCGGPSIGHLRRLCWQGVPTGVKERRRRWKSLLVPCWCFIYLVLWLRGCCCRCCVVAFARRRSCHARASPAFSPCSTPIGNSGI